ncbi:hypothetical protein ACF0H5_014426 [Mactra antiquata]
MGANALGESVWSWLRNTEWVQDVQKANKGNKTWEYYVTVTCDLTASVNNSKIDLTAGMLNKTTTTISMKKFMLIKVCPNSYGIHLTEYHKIPGVIWCLNQCERNTSCTSCTFDARYNICRLNGGVMTLQTTSGCDLIDYAEITTEDPPPDIPLLSCVSSYGCTEVKQGFRMCDGGGAGICDVTRGRLEVFLNNVWGTVCDDKWRTTNVINADVACKMFGYVFGRIRPKAMIQNGTGQIWLDNVACVGTETTLLDCPQIPWGEGNCDHSEDVGIECSHEPFP